MTKQKFQAAVLARIGGNKNHGWGGEDSLTVILAIVKDFYSDAKMAGKEIDGDAKEQIKSLVNPSAYRQVLEDQKVLNESVKGSKKVKRDFNQFEVAATPAK